MKAYLQFADGQEIDCSIVEPDPKDGSYVVEVPVGTKLDMTEPGLFWIRVCPND